MRNGYSSSMRLLLAVIAIFIYSAHVSAHGAESVELGQQVKDGKWRITCQSSKQITRPQSVRVMPLGPGLQIVRDFVPLEGNTLIEIVCAIENAMSVQAHYSLKDIHTFSIPEGTFSVIGISLDRTIKTDDPVFNLTLVNPEIADTKVTVSPGEKQEQIFLFLAKAKFKALRFQFRDLSPYRLK